MVFYADGAPEAGSTVPEARVSAIHSDPLGSSPSMPLQRRGTVQRWPIPREDEVLVVPIGGLGRIGMNWTLYGHDGRWILVDAGVGFPEEQDRGDVDAWIPDPAALAPILGKLDALIVTHAHEDHIGGIDRVFPHAINCPIWATPFAAALIARRLDEAGVLDEVEIRTFPVGASFRAGTFDVQSIAVTHSIPEPVALALRTRAGTVVHTGDWKLDPNPLIGEPTDLAAFRALGDEGVLAMIGDSTNAHRELPETSEIHVREAFRRLFASRDGTVVISCFSSNVARLASAAVAADEARRKIAVAGRSLRSNEETADQLGLLDGIPQFLAEPSHLKGLDRRECAMVCTGTQGEENAALARMARGDRRLPTLEKGDTVVMSSRVVPGNEEAVERVASALRALGVEVLQAGDLVEGFPVHVSGHAGARELRTMHELLRPRFAIPVHGEDHHLKAHAAIALSLGAKQAPILRDGDILAATHSGLRHLGTLRVPMAPLLRDENGDRMPYEAPRVTRERKRAPAAAGA